METSDYDHYNSARHILDSLSLRIYVIDDQFVLQDLNQAGLDYIKHKHFDKSKKEKCYALIYKREEVCPFCPLLIEKERQMIQNLPINPLEKIIHSMPLEVDSQIDSNTQGFPTSDKNSNISIKRADYPEKFYRVIFLRHSQEPSFLIESIEDVTSQKEKQDQALTNENLAALGVMLSGISHELNNSLTGMGLNLQNLLANHASMNTDERAKRLEILRKDMYQASQITSDILLFSNPSRPHLTRTKILRIVHNAIDKTRRLYPVLSRPVDWYVEGEEIIFPLRPESIERLLINLFRNSLQAFDYKPGKIQVSLKKVSRAVHIVVEDNAGGIEPNKIKNIFQPFYTNTPDGKGSGLGLSVCHSIVTEHNGYIHVRAVPGGVRFYISLPLDHPDRIIEAG